MSQTGGRVSLAIQIPFTVQSVAVHAMIRAQSPIRRFPVIIQLPCAAKRKRDSAQLQEAKRKRDSAQLQETDRKRDYSIVSVDAKPRRFL
jgi:hypothetical protein